MKTIEVDDDVFEGLEARARGFGDSPNLVIKRLIEAASLTGPAVNGSNGDHSSPKEVSPFFGLLNSAEFQREDGKGRYKLILRRIHETNPEGLRRFVGYRRGSRVNIALDPKSIEESGSSTMPESVEGTPYYVLTNLSNKRKREILGDILQGLRYSPDDADEILKSIPDSGITRKKRIDLSPYV